MDGWDYIGNRVQSPPMAVPITSVREGTTVQLDGSVNVVQEYKHVRKSQQACVRIKFKEMKTGAIFERTFDVNEKIEEAYVDRKKMQFLYRDSDAFHFMDQETFDQIAVPAGRMKDNAPYLKEGLGVQIMLYDNDVVGVDLPRSVELRVTETAPDMRGNTASGGTKPATLETGLVVNVPFFMKVDDIIRIDTRDGAYIERV